MSKKNINTTSALSEEVKNKSGETALRTEPNQLLSDSVPDIISGKRLLNDCLYSPVLSFVLLKLSSNTGNRTPKLRTKPKFSALQIAAEIHTTQAHVLSCLRLLLKHHHSFPSLSWQSGSRSLYTGILQLIWNLLPEEFDGGETEGIFCAPVWCKKPLLRDSSCSDFLLQLKVKGSGHT